MTIETEAKLQAHFASAEKYSTSFGEYRDTLPRIICDDGTTMSVQVGSGLYCSPRDSDGPWYAVEIGYPSRKIDGIMEWAESPESPTDTVYGYVPLTVLARAIDEECGGFAGIAPKVGAA
jgi:hypothetical protein